eukprot:s150_g8.t3
MPAFLVALVFGSLTFWARGDACEEDEVKVVLLQTQVKLAASTPSLKPLGHSFYSTDPARSAAWWLRYSTSQALPAESSGSRLNLIGLAESEEASAVQVQDSDGPIKQLHFFKTPSSRSTERLAMQDFVKAAELSWDSVMHRQQLYSPWTDFHVGLKVDTMRADHFQEDNQSFQYYIPKLASESWNCKVIRAYIPNTTWTVEWHADLLSPRLLTQELLESRRTEDPDHCRGSEGPEMRETWWKSTFAVANASAARDFAIKVLAAVPRGEPYPWPPQPDCIAAQWVTLPDDGVGERTPMQMHFVEDRVYSSIWHGVPELLQYQRDFVRSHPNCINSFMLNNLILETGSLDPFIRRLAETSTPHFVFQVSGTFALIFSFPGNEMDLRQLRRFGQVSLFSKPLTIRQETRLLQRHVTAAGVFAVEPLVLCCLSWSKISHSGGAHP